MSNSDKKEIVKDGVIGEKTMKFLSKMKEKNFDSSQFKATVVEFEKPYDFRYEVNKCWLRIKK